MVAAVTFGQIALGLLGAAAGALLIDRIVKVVAPAAPTWQPIAPNVETVVGKWYRWSIVTTSDLATARAIFAPHFASLQAWPTISLPIDWPASDQGTNRLRFQGQAREVMDFPSAWNPALFELS